MEMNLDTIDTLNLKVSVAGNMYNAIHNRCAKEIADNGYTGQWMLDLLEICVTHQTNLAIALF